MLPLIIKMLTLSKVSDCYSVQTNQRYSEPFRIIPKKVLNIFRYKSVEDQFDSIQINPN